ncbi:MAG: quinone-dependent dihydroorotate dehydrogenase [Calditrichaeota bacterium]|nr:MAG: quinone-dependent dihydroorotate dehydrogenase [Calditrichota bacterium]MBL1206633.1 quinone-dependent dihydroorotate dehydrogenase [Calditrichota bacterium]NOG46460.1 quinone-dependent dihydroorotate dehydrogenase [Calditrichota bacterium]
MYKKIIRPLFFKADPEKIHKTTLAAISNPLIQGVLKTICNYSASKLKKTVFGIDFQNPIGLAAGFDKNAEHIDGFAAMGFGFVEIGTVTPLAQPGNPIPRLFRLKVDSAIINRMGFNNEGLETAVENIKKSKSGIIIGGNIGKNKLTPNEQAVDDYLKGFDALYDFVDYFVVNVSSPNTPGLRELQEKKPLMHILNSLQKRNDTKVKRKPILLKIAPDLTDAQLDDIIEIVKETKTDGIVATNTTISRENLKSRSELIQNIGDGGLSGKPVFDRSNEVIRYIKKNSTITVIGVGGISSANDALEKIKAGADLIQIYTGLIYEGPLIVKRTKKLLALQEN